MDLDALLPYLGCLQPGYESHVFYWSAAHPDGRRVQTYATLEEILPRLVSRNDEGFGIFTTINAMTPRFTGGLARRTKADVAAVRAVMLDWDRPNEKMPKPPIEPSMYVETSPGKWHLYWCVDDMALDQFEVAQRGIVQFFGGDRSVVDLPREVRVPGFDHTKGTPVPVKLAKCRGRRYKAAQILAAFPFDIQTKFREHVEVPPMANLTHAIVDYVWGPIQPSGGYNVPCPWASAHTTPSNPSSTVYFPPSQQHGPAGYFKCMHNHCADRCADEFDRWLREYVRSRFQ